MIPLLQKCRKWTEFGDGIRHLFRQEKGRCFEIFTKHLLTLHPTYSTQLKQVWFLRDVPRRIRTKLNLPGPDEGIDLIAETNVDSYWAIQCKYRDDESSSLTRRELSTFTDLAFTICRNIDFALVCTNANRFSRKLTLYGERLSFCSGEVYRSLSPEFFRRLHRLLQGKIVPPTPLTPRMHQQRAIENAYKHFVVEGNSRGKMIMPCGTGKSLAGYWIAQKLGARKILVAVPSLALIRQTYEVWAREIVANKQNAHWIAVCSDESVGDVNRDDIAVLTQDLGIRVHTNPDEIAKWLRAKKHPLTVVFTTYQSGRAISEAVRKSGEIFDVGIMDEAHKTVGKRESLFTHLLYDKNIRIRKRIFTTATERRYRGESNQIVSMDNPKLYGDTFEMLSFKKALESKPPILSDYKIVTIAVSREDISELINRNLFVKPDTGKWDSDIESQMLATTVALRKAMQKYPIRHAVSFHSSIARARAFKATQVSFSDAFPKFGGLETFHVSGKTPTAVRSDQLEEFASAGRSLVTNARCLTEGVDVPGIDCVLFADPRKSTIDIVQAVGRALRVAKGKQYGYVVVPVLMEGETSAQISSQDNGFASVLTVLRALAANDERIVEYFRTISQGRKWTGGTIPFEMEIPDGVVVDTSDFINSINLQFWSRLARLASKPFPEAREFVHKLGLKGESEWRKYYLGELPEKGKRPEDIPTNPNRTYKDNGWAGWGDWVGTGAIAPNLRIYQTFPEAREFVRNLGLKNNKEWRKYCRGQMPENKKPEDIPTNPEVVYKDQCWGGYGDWLGTGIIASSLIKYRSFKQARKFVRNLGLKNREEWTKYCRGQVPKKGIKPEDIPATPERTYKNKGWAGNGDWLGTRVVATRLRKYRPFQQARKFVRGLGLKDVNEWRKYSQGLLPEKGKKPDDIPTDVHRIYKNKGWASYGDWLGTGVVASSRKTFRPFREAREFVHRLGLRNQKEWLKYFTGELPEKGKKPEDIPTTPSRIYKDQGWAGWGDWLRTGTIVP